MAISKILHMNPYKNSEGLHLKQGIKYILNESKTEQGLYTGAVNCSLESAYEDMRSTKELYGKTDKRQAYHLIISFEEGETNPETAYEIVQEFVDKYLADNYEAVYSVHNDTDHIHGHIIWNSVRFTDGYKYRYEKGDWEKTIQPLVNKICKEHGLNELDLSKEKEVDVSWDRTKDGNFVWSEQIKKDVDSCILSAADFPMFIQRMEEKGYQVKYGKYLAVKPIGMARFRRLKTLGDEYSESNIRNRIARQAVTGYRRSGIPSSPKIRGFRGNFSKRKLTGRKLTGLKKEYFRMLYRLGKIKKKSYSQSYKYKDDIKRLGMLQKQYLFLSRNNLNTLKDIEDKQKELRDRSKSLAEKMGSLITENEKQKDLYDAIATIKKEKQAAAFYYLGDESFKEQADKVESAKNTLKNAGLNYDQVKKMQEDYQKAIKACDKEIRLIKEDIKTSKKIVADIVNRREVKVVRKPKQLGRDIAVQTGKENTGKEESKQISNKTKNNTEKRR